MEVFWHAVVADQVQMVDLGLNADQIREVTAVILLVPGGLFDFAGWPRWGTGVYVQNWFTSLWGSIGYLIPFMVLELVWGCFFRSFSIKTAVLVGCVLLALAAWPSRYYSHGWRCDW